MKDISLSKKEIEKLRKLGVLDEISLRNIWIEREIKRKLKEENKSKSQIKEEIAENNCMTIDALNMGLYRQRNKNIDYQAPIDELK